MAMTIFYRRTFHVGAKVDTKGPRLEFNAAGEELDKEGVESLVRQLQGWLNEVKWINICTECNTRRPLHRPGCRQAPITY